MVFKVAFEKEGKYLVKAEFKPGEGDKWANTTQAVYNYAKKNFKKDETVHIEYREQNGKYFVDKIVKAGGQTEPASSVPVTEKGKPEQPKAEYKSSWQKSPEVQDLIVRQSTLASACQAIQVLTGQINDVQALGDMIETLYDKFYKKIKD